MTRKTTTAAFAAAIALALALAGCSSASSASSSQSAASAASAEASASSAAAADDVALSDDPSDFVLLSEAVRDAMLAHGFKPLEEEWWHFTLADEPYPDTYFTFPVNSDSLDKAA